MRLSKYSGWILPLALCAVPAAAQAPDEPLVLAPTSAWVVDYAEDSCALRRAFAGENRQAILELRQPSPTDGLYILVASDMPVAQGESSVRFLPDQDAANVTAPTAGSVGENMNAIRFWQSLRPGYGTEPSFGSQPWPEQEREAREKAIEGLQLSGSFERDLVLPTGELHQPMTALRACVDDLLGHWGLDAQVQRTLSRQVQPIRQADWARRTMEAYPADMVRTGQGARVDVRVMVGADGKPTSCSVPAGTVHPSFEKAACGSSMRHARFEPALDAQGQPVPSYFVTTVVYTLMR